VSLVKNVDVYLKIYSNQPFEVSMTKQSKTQAYLYLCKRNLYESTKQYKVNCVEDEPELWFRENCIDNDDGVINKYVPSSTLDE